MPTSKSAKERMNRAVNEAVAAGDSFRANEITANVMVGTTMMIIFGVMILCLILNEVGVFTADKMIMRWAVMLAAVILAPITILNTEYVGAKSWLRVPLMIDLIVVCGILAATLGHNVTLVMVFPVVVSTRYFDRKYTRNVALITAFVFAVSSIVNGYFGIMNLNMIHFSDDVTLTVLKGHSLRDAVIASGFDVKKYIISSFLNDFVPRCIVFLSLSVSCWYVADRGRRMIETHAETSKKTSRIETELDLATRIQTSMLPCLLPAFPGHDDIDLRAVYHPAKEVGGDFYDYFIIDKNHVGMVIADVSGKGVGAALFMTISKTVLKNQLLLGISPAEALTNSNRQLCENNDAGLFVTCWAGVYDTESGILTYVNAGHNPPVIMRKGEKPEFFSKGGGLVLAGFDDYVYTQKEIKLNTGDEVFFYTDGVTEATDASNNLYGENRLIECLDAVSGESVNDQLVRLKESIDEFAGDVPQFDDITIMGMRIT